jgi:hypothetical protein
VLLENGQCLLQGLGVGTDDEDLLLDKPDGFVFLFPGDLHQQPT